MQNRIKFLALLLAGTAVCIIGCEQQRQPVTPESSPISEPSASRDESQPTTGEREQSDLPSISSQQYTGPDFTVTAQSTDGSRTIMLETTARSGGWELTLDKAGYADGKMQVFLTFEKPGPMQMVTQSLEEHSVTIQTDKRAFSVVGVYVNLLTRDKPDRATGYRLAATEQVSPRQ